jgi:hypothetical protein
MTIYRYIYHRSGEVMGSIRTIITLSEEDKRWLESYSSAHQVSLAEAIRQGIRRLKDAELQETYGVLVQSTKGLWKKGDGLKYQRKIRSEWHP